MGNLPKQKRKEFESLIMAFLQNCKTENVKVFGYGSYYENVPECGDVDIFVKISKTAVTKYIREEKHKLRTCEREGFDCGECAESENEGENEDGVHVLPACFWGKCPENDCGLGLDSELRDEFFKLIREKLTKGFKESLIKGEKGLSYPYYSLSDNPKVFLQLALGFSCAEYSDRFPIKPRFTRIYI